MPSLTRAEAQTRAALLTITHTDLDLDLDHGPDTFVSTARIRFTCREPGSATFLDVRPVELHEITLNGAPLDPADLREHRMELNDLLAENVLTVRATMAYSHDGQGLHRSVDPADQEHYVYGHLFLDAAPAVFGCFDQPDLKSTYAVTVTAPETWSVIGNGAAHRIGPGRWELAATPPLATYVVTVCAGPYISVRDEHDGIPLGIHARASLEGPLRAQADQMLEVTRAAFDEYHRLFGIRYPFGEYHQVFVPEFNAGAMENPGCVTIRDAYVFRGAATREEILTRSNTITHEMAHMWFGDLVTMTWWDDLWLNESFAEYMAHRVCVAATEFTDNWVDATMARKLWGYAAERAPSTHPVAGSPAPDAQSALGNFDGISYAKGASVLRQLIAHIGDEPFVAGVTAYLRDHAFGNGELADFLGAIAKASATDLEQWGRAWLQTAGVDVISVEPGAGVVHREAPEAFPADRPHTLDVAGFTDGREVYRVGLRLTSSQERFPEIASAPAAALVVPNAGDLTWATVVLDPESQAALPDQLGRVPDPQARAVAWVGLIDGVALGAVDPERLLETFAAAWPVETNESILGRVAGQLVSRYVPTFLAGDARERGEAVVAEAAAALLELSAGHTGRALIAARTLARTTGDVDLLRRWAAGHDLPHDLTQDADFRWVVVQGLARRGGLEEDQIETFRRTDDSLAGRLGALTARALRPTAEAKAWAWSTLTGDRSRSNYELNAVAAGFWDTPDLDLVRPYVSRYFAEVPGLHAWVGEDALARVARLAYPWTIVEEATLDASRTTLAETELTASVRRAMVDAQSELEEARRSRARFVR